MESSNLIVSRSPVRAISCSAVGAEFVEVVRVDSCPRSCPNSSWRELIIVSLSESDDFNVAISLSFNAVCCVISRLYFSYRYSLYRGIHLVKIMQIIDLGGIVLRNLDQPIESPTLDLVERRQYLLSTQLSSLMEVK